MDKQTAVARVLKELDRAESRFAPFKSAHEGHAVIREEFEEQWAEIKAIKWDGGPIDNALETESIQLAAMTLRFIVDLL